MLRAVASGILWAGCLTRQMCPCCCSPSLCWVLHQVFPIWSRTRPAAAVRLLKQGRRVKEHQGLVGYSPLPTEPFTQGSLTQSTLNVPCPL